MALAGVNEMIVPYAILPICLIPLVQKYDFVIYHFCTSLPNFRFWNLSLKYVLQPHNLKQLYAIQGAHRAHSTVLCGIVSKFHIAVYVKNSGNTSSVLRLRIPTSETLTLKESR